MHLYAEKADHELGEHIVLACSRKEQNDVRDVIVKEILEGKATPVVHVEGRGEEATILFRLHKKYLDYTALAFPMADLSPPLSAKLRKAEEKRLEGMEVPAIWIPGMRRSMRRRMMGYQKIAAKKIVDNEIVMLNDEMGLGKGQLLDMPVLSPRGWRKMGDLVVGDYVIGKNGNPTKVVGVYPQGVRPCYRFTFSDGSDVDVDENHLWSVQTANDVFRGSDTWRVVSTAQVVAEEPVQTKGSGQNTGKSYKWTPKVKQANGNRNLRIPMVEPVRFKSVSLPLDPYVLGVVLGDGCIRSPRQAVVDKGCDTESLMQCVSSAGGRLGPTLSVGFSIRADFDVLGLIGTRSSTKVVPRPYVFASPDERLALLQGLMDTDGYAMPDGGNEFCSTSPHLISAVREIVQSLGGIAKPAFEACATYSHKGEKKVGQRAWRTNIKLHPSMCPFRLPRKVAEHVACTKYPPVRQIEAVQRIEDAETVCIRVAASDELYVTKDYIVTHNSVSVLAAIKKLDAFPALIVCPNSALDEWASQIQEHFWGISFTICGGTKMQREQAVWKGADITLVNYEALRAKPLHKTQSKHSQIVGYNFATPALFERTYAFAVCDESHRLKTSQAQTTQGFFQLEAERWLYMSGTPILNRPEEIWTILHKSYPEQFPSYKKFKENLCVMRNGIGNSQKVVGYKPRELSKLRDFIHTVSLRRRKDQVFDQLPPVITSVRTITMSLEQRKLYDEIRDDLRLRLDDGSVKSIFGALPQLTRLKQACYAGETKIITANGTKKIKDVVGTKQYVLSSPIVKVTESGAPRRGAWKEASISSFGRQRVLRVTVSRFGIEKVIRATPDHVWFASLGGEEKRREIHSVRTDELKPKMILASLLPASMKGRSKPSPIGIAAGIVFGDGSKTPGGARVTLYGDKWVDLKRYFRGHHSHASEREDKVPGVTVMGLPKSFKDYPLLSEGEAFLSGWIAGYIATDGCVDKSGRSVTIASSSRSHLMFAKTVANRVGIATMSIRKQRRIGANGVLSDLFQMSFVRATISPELLIRSKHRDRFAGAGSTEQAQARWKVVDVEDQGEVEEVFCASVPGTHTFALDDYIWVHNCFSPELYGGSTKSTKIDEVKEIVATLIENGEKAIIFSQWSRATRILKRELAQYNPAYVDGDVPRRKGREFPRREQAVRFMNDPKVQLYIGTIGTNKEAINLGVASYVIFTDLDWSPMTMDQAVGRSAGGGLRGLNLKKGLKVNVIEIQAEDTVEQGIVELLKRKRNLTGRTIDRDGGKAHVPISLSDIRSLIG